MTWINVNYVIYCLVNKHFVGYFPSINAKNTKHFENIQNAQRESINSMSFTKGYQFMSSSSSESDNDLSNDR